MSVSFESLEHKVGQVVAVCTSLRDENHALRTHVTSLEKEKAALTKKVDTTLERLEGLMARLPGE